MARIGQPAQVADGCSFRLREVVLGDQVLGHGRTRCARWHIQRPVIVWNHGTASQGDPQRY